MEKVEVLVVGAGIAGLSTAMTLAQAGAEVIVVERGDYPGGKNVTGGRLYLGPIRPYLLDIWENAPLERRVVKERLTMAAPESSITVEMDSQRFRQPPYSSYTLLHSTFDRWYADLAASHGALITPGYKVDDLIIENGQVKGIIVNGDEIRADVVVAADGVLSFMAEKAGLRKKRPPKDFAVGYKEIIELPAEKIEDRFHLAPGEGSAHMFFGSLSAGMLGGGFLYTNRESISLGMVVGIHDLMEKQPPVQPHDLLEAFKERPEIKPLIAGGNTVEYSAHAIQERGYHGLLPHPFTNGMVVVGEAAGFALNTGITVRGLDFAIASGVLAARTILRAREQKDFSAASLGYYETLLKESFVWKDIVTFKHMPRFLDNPRLFTHYPAAVCNLFEQVMRVDEKPKERFMKTIMQSVRRDFLKAGVIKDMFRVFKI